MCPINFFLTTLIKVNEQTSDWKRDRCYLLLFNKYVRGYLLYFLLILTKF